MNTNKKIHHNSIVPLSIPFPMKVGRTYTDKRHSHGYGCHPSSHFAIIFHHYIHFLIFIHPPFPHSSTRSWSFSQVWQVSTSSLCYWFFNNVFLFYIMCKEASCCQLDTVRQKSYQNKILPARNWLSGQFRTNILWWPRKHKDIYLFFAEEESAKIYLISITSTALI